MSLSMTSIASIPRSPSSAPQRAFSLFVLVLSLAVIGGALVFQYGVGLVPCELCLAERYAWYAAIPLAGLFLIAPASLGRFAAPLFLLLFLASAGLAFYHVGVEQHVFAGPTACTAGKLQGGSIEDMTKALLATPEVQCDEVQWSLLGISLSGFNLILSLSVVVVAARIWLTRKEHA
jgi:disulfide bond formation protein DsbB